MSCFMFEEEAEVPSAHLQQRQFAPNRQLSAEQNRQLALGTHLLWPLANRSNLADWEGRCVTGEDTVRRDHLWQGVEEIL